jgi:flagellar biosynthetic protein FlhB
MANGDRTEKATPKKRREARKKGQIFKSMELSTGLSLLLMFGTLSVLGAYMADNLQKYLVSSFGMQIPDTLTSATVQKLFITTAVRMFVVLLPMLGTAVAGGLAFNLVQTGFFASGSVVAPKFSRISMVQGFKRIFSKNTLMDLIKTIIKLCAVGYCIYGEFETQQLKMPALMTQNVDSSVASMSEIIIGSAFKISIVLAVFGPLDYLYQWWRYEKDLMMTKQEVKDEYKQTEGNPQIKGRIRQKQRQMSGQRMLKAVEKADVVITNPTHFAVALEYDEAKSRAPVVLAKGADYIARKIREKATELGVEIVENKPLARQLYFFCDIGEEIPEELYQAVAEILAYIYSIKKKGKGNVGR